MCLLRASLSCTRRHYSLRPLQALSIGRFIIPWSWCIWTTNNWWSFPLIIPTMLDLTYVGAWNHEQIACDCHFIHVVFSCYVHNTPVQRHFCPLLAHKASVITWPCPGAITSRDVFFINRMKNFDWSYDVVRNFSNVFLVYDVHIHVYVHMNLWRCLRDITMFQISFTSLLEIP